MNEEEKKEEIKVDESKVIDANGDVNADEVKKIFDNVTPEDLVKELEEEAKKQWTIKRW